MTNPVNLDYDFLKRCRKITEYYEQKQGGSWSIDKQLLKIHEELTEMQKAPDIKNLLEECCDTILASITVFDLLGISSDRINVIMERTLRKVEARITKKEKRND